jgi:hypothetical protein
MNNNRINWQFWKDKNLTAQEKNEMLKETCRKVFGSDEGKIVLNMLLTDMFLFENTHTKREHVLNEYAKFFIREWMGVSGSKDLTDFIAETAASAGGK